MTLQQYIDDLQRFAHNRKASGLTVIFHDTEGIAGAGTTDICVDGTCSEDEPQVVRITMIDVSECHDCGRTEGEQHKDECPEAAAR
jgi:hypothetical protein